MWVLCEVGLGLSFKEKPILHNSAKCKYEYSKFNVRNKTDCS